MRCNNFIFGRQGHFQTVKRGKSGLRTACKAKYPQIDPNSPIFCLVLLSWIWKAHLSCVTRGAEAWKSQCPLAALKLAELANWFDQLRTGLGKSLFVLLCLSLCSRVLYLFSERFLQSRNPFCGFHIDQPEGENQRFRQFCLRKRIGLANAIRGARIKVNKTVVRIYQSLHLAISWE